MLPTYDDPTPLRIMGIDPGTDTLGICVLDVSLDSDQVFLKMVQTYSGTQMSKAYQYIQDIHGAKVARLTAHQDNFRFLLSHWHPQCVICEAPYLGHFAAAYAALVECLSYLRVALMEYDYRLPLLMVDPPTVKKTVGVNGKSGDKGLMLQAVLSLFEKGQLLNPLQLDIAALDDHSIDSIAVAYTQAKGLIDNNHYYR